MLKTLLEMWKYLVIEAKDGTEAINIAEKTCPDLILLDVKMPNLEDSASPDKSVNLRKSKVCRLSFFRVVPKKIYKQKASTVGGNEYLTKPLEF